jgi:SAM-dependent methyltransferase
VLGIPDFRVFPDPWIGLEDDRAKGIELARRTEGADFEQTVRAYWAMTPSTSTARAERFIAHVLEGHARAEEWLRHVVRDEGAAEGPWLEIGCGTADLVGAALARGLTMIGADIAFRWLVVARKRLPATAPDFTLVCCNGEHLPFATGAVARVVSVGTLEHCTDARAVVAEGRRVLRPGGSICVRTVNRFTVLDEPHVGVWGVGFLPRRWADAYVRWRSGQRYLHHRPLSSLELSRALRRAGFDGVRVGAARLLSAERKRLGASAQHLAPAYEQLRRTSGTGVVLGVIAPLLEGRGVAR